MKVAAGVLAASLLFFLGVMTGAGRQEAAAPPMAIPLGVASQAEEGGDGKATPTSPTTRKPGTVKTTTSTRVATPSPADPSSPAIAPTPTPPAPIPDPAQPPATTAPPTTATTARSGEVEQVDSQVDCAPAGRRGRGRREPCPSTTTTTAQDPGTSPTTTGDRRGGRDNR